MVMDAVLMLEAMAIKNDIFEEDILSLHANPKQARDELMFPYQLTQKPGAGERPLFTQERKRTARPKQDLLSSEGMLKRPHVSDDEPPRPAKKSHRAANRPVLVDSDDEPELDKKAPPSRASRAGRHTGIIKYAGSDGEAYPMSVTALDHFFRKVGKQLNHYPEVTGSNPV
jgi:hypothetical protein